VIYLYDCLRIISCRIHLTLLFGITIKASQMFYICISVVTETIIKVCISVG